MGYPRPMSSKNRAALAALVALALIVGGYWAYTAQQKRAQQRAVAAALQDTTARLRDSLAVAPNSSGRRSLQRLEGHAEAVDAHLKLVRDAAARDPELSDGAEHYVLGAREILRRQTASIRQSEQSAASRASLLGHMRRAARRDAAWIREAMLQKKIVEAHYFDYGLTLKALADLLLGFPDTKKRLAPLVDPGLLLEVGPAEDARRMVLKESRRVAEELDSVRRLAPR